ncbi:MAG: hypothetical protein O9292_01580 [Rhodobacteraceae bacterium]|nr:hypothetical protein [Paracoccaceae bacterium]MCZ8333196.1 hypothetical protein [Paracoccaceae bacterium]
MMQRLAALLLSLCLALTSVTAAVAHVQSAGAQQITLCGTPGVEETITLNAMGEPIPTPHHCPDCLAVTAGAAPSAPPLERPQTRGERQALALIAAPDPAQALSPSARGPPARI